MYQITTGLKKLLKLRKRIRIVQGGTSAGKTIDILLIIVDYCQLHANTSASVVSESLPHLKRGAMRDFLKILQAQGYYKEDNWNRTNFTYYFENGSYVEFFGVDSSDKVRGPRRDILFINEANNVSYEIFNQLEVRTRVAIWLDFNPTASFWVHEEIMRTEDFEYDFEKLTYKDNEALDEALVKSIESRKNNKNWWRVYGLGEVGVNEGQVYDNWELIDKVPEDARLERYGMDFGYTNDPTVIAGIYMWNDALVIDEVVHSSGLSNKDIAEIILAQQPALVIADSAEPKSIDEIKILGVNIIGSVKGQGSVSQGIQLVQDQKVYITKNSTNIIKDFRNYLWKVDRSGKALNIPSHDFSHSPDAVRYGITDLIGPRFKIEYASPIF